MSRLLCLLLTLTAMGLQMLPADDTDTDTDTAYPSKTSTDGRIKVTLLYVGPINDWQIHKPFVVTYMIEDCRTDEENQKHPWKDSNGKVVDFRYYIGASTPEAYDSHHRRIVFNADERACMYALASDAQFKASYPSVVLPSTDHPKATAVYEYFLKEAPTLPLDITLHDSIPAYRANEFRFRDAGAAASSSSPSP